MSTQTYVNNVTLSDATEFNRFDTAAYCYLTGVAGTNTITATGPANMTLAAPQHPIVLVPAVTNTGATTLNITPSGGAALTAKNVFYNGVALVAGELKAGVPSLLVYDGTQYNIIGTSAGVGTWTPALTFATPGDLSVAYTTQVGTYTKIGRQVTAHCIIVTSTFTHTTASGGLTVSGLPFSSTANRFVGALDWSGITKAGYTNIVAEKQSVADALVTFFASGSAVARSAVGSGDCPTGGTMAIIFSITYEAAA